MEYNIGQFIASKRKELGYTQQYLADKLNISFQAVSKWEQGASTPDVSLLPGLARILHTSVDAIVGYSYTAKTDYEERYKDENYYWGIAPNRLCYEIMKLRPPIKPYKVLDMGCGEGKDAVFLARNGYQVTAFDASESGLKKARELAARNGVEVDFIRADINEFKPVEMYDIVFSSGVCHYIRKDKRASLFKELKEHTTGGGIHAMNVFVQKPFIEMAPDSEEIEKETEPWYSGELLYYYNDWLFHKNEEIIFDCNSGGIPHRHCMDIMIAEKGEADAET